MDSLTDWITAIGTLIAAIAAIWAGIKARDAKVAITRVERKVEQTAIFGGSGGPGGAGGGGGGGGLTGGSGGEGARIYVDGRPLFEDDTER